MMNMYVDPLRASLPIDRAFDGLLAIASRYVVPSALIVLSLVAVLLLDLWLIEQETRRWTRRRRSGPKARSEGPAAGASGSEARRPTTAGFA